MTFIEVNRTDSERTKVYVQFIRVDAIEHFGEAGSCDPRTVIKVRGGEAFYVKEGVYTVAVKIEKALGENVE